MKGTLLSTFSPSWRITSLPQSRSTSPEKTCDLTCEGQTESKKKTTNQITKKKKKKGKIKDAEKFIGFVHADMPISMP